MTMESIASLMQRVRKSTYFDTNWELLAQPVPLIQMKLLLPVANKNPNHHGNKSRRYLATGITPQAQDILKQLPLPLHIIAFAGLGRSGKSRTATEIRAKLTGNHNHKFHAAPGNVPVTHGIDMLVFKASNLLDGHIIFLDCEGGANHNQTALPFVIGLAARLSARMYIFERACFTTNGLDTVMQVLNMANATATDQTCIPKSIVLVENMTINQEIPNTTLLQDLLCEDEGDEAINCIRSLIKDRFQVEFNKIPYNNDPRKLRDSGYGRQTILSQYDDVCCEMAQGIIDNLVPFEIGGVQGDGAMVVQLINELILQIRRGGNRFNMVTATEALVNNMAMEAATTLWNNMMTQLKLSGNLPTQITGRKPLEAIMREVERVAIPAVHDLDSFVSRLEPPGPACVGRQYWDRMYDDLQREIRESYILKHEKVMRYRAWRDRTHIVMAHMYALIWQTLHYISQFVRYASRVVAHTGWFSLTNKLGLGMIRNAFFKGILV
ncbi:hypothetical protein QVD99_004108 [Batrachochytrium dendrobatidis]|nr:hypothetical protein QVD99_004108 [Batrachochytrium dendrobatidis]